MLSSRARAALQRAFSDAVAAELAHRTEAPAQAEREALGERLELMAVRLAGFREGCDEALALQLRDLARRKDFADIEAIRVQGDLSPAEVVALIISTGDRTTGARSSPASQKS